MQADRQKNFYFEDTVLWQFHCCRCTHFNIGLLAQRHFWNYEGLPYWLICLGIWPEFEILQILSPWCGIREWTRYNICQWLMDISNQKSCYKWTLLSDSIKVKYTKKIIWPKSYDRTVLYSLPTHLITIQIYRIDYSHVNGLTS